MDNSRFKFRVWLAKENKYSKKLYQFIDNDGLLLQSKITEDDIYGLNETEEDDIIESCTGLKDKNSKLIYEGDIVEFYSYSVLDVFSGEPMKRRVGVVVWNDEMLKFDITVNGKAIPDLCKKIDDNQFVIIGNIHENPELLEANNDKSTTKNKVYFKIATAKK